jgi:hypothetical protein
MAHTLSSTLQLAVTELYCGGTWQGIINQVCIRSSIQDPYTDLATSWTISRNPNGCKAHSLDIVQLVAKSVYGS